MKFHLSDKKLLFIFILISIILRLFSFFPSVLDHDESTYMIIGRDILNGKSLYTDVTDTKPVGIFLFYALLEFLFGDSIFLKRLVFAIIVGITAYLISGVSKKMFGNKRVAFASGLIYLIYTSTWTLHGRSPNTELLFNLTTISTLLLFLNPRKSNFFLGGLITGIGFIIKYLVLFDLAAFMLFFFIIDILNNRKVIRDISFWYRYVLAGTGFLIPFGLVNIWFWLFGNYDAFYFITFELPSNYGSNPSLSRYITMLVDFTAKFLPVSFMFYYVIFKREKPVTVRQGYFFLLWIIFILVAIYLPGREFSHYTVQLMLPFSLVAGIFFHPDFTTDRITSKIFSRKTGWALLIGGTLIIQAITFDNEIVDPDYPREIAGLIEESLKPGEQIFVSNYEHVIYYLLDLNTPTRFVHSVLLFSDYHKAFNINAAQEVQRIIAQKPAFIVVERKNELVEKLIKENYRLIRKFRNNEIKLYKRN